MVTPFVIWSYVGASTAHKTETADGSIAGDRKQRGSAKSTSDVASPKGGTRISRKVDPAVSNEQWENHSNRVSSFLFLPHGGNGAAITKKLEQKGRKLVLPVEEISTS